jgi:glycosyltransferase involved in cell wall biosynthesis
MEKISVCVPTYNRPDTLKVLIKTFLKQDYKNKELVISDDTPNNSIEKLVRSFRNKSIKYFHNEVALGFSKNFLASMERAKGDYILTIGDDDLLFTEKVLSTYVKKFRENPKVFYLYSNLIQFSDNMQVEYIINNYSKDTYFRRGAIAMKGMWLSSIFIGGIGIRNKISLKKFYPKKKILHPQVELIGNIINMHDAYAISDNLIGVRSHNDQIIFRALKNKKIRQDGHHMTVELFDIFKFLKKRFKLPLTFDFAANQLIQLQLVMMFKEKSNLGNKEMKKHYEKFCTISKVAKNSLKFKLACFLAELFPSNIIFGARTLALKSIAFKHRKRYLNIQRKLENMVS